jgi:hypothetical protein
MVGYIYRRVNTPARRFGSTSTPSASSRSPPLYPSFLSSGKKSKPAAPVRLSDTLDPVSDNRSVSVVRYRSDNRLYSPSAVLHAFDSTFFVFLGDVRNIKTCGTETAASSTRPIPLNPSLNLQVANVSGPHRVTCPSLPRTGKKGKGSGHLHQPEPCRKTNGTLNPRP